MEESRRGSVSATLFRSARRLRTARAGCAGGGEGRFLEESRVGVGVRGCGWCVEVWVVGSRPGNDEG